MRIPKHVLVMGDSIFCIKKCLGYRIKIIFNALKTVALGAHFKSYNILLRQVKPYKKLSKCELSNFFCTFWTQKNFIFFEHFIVSILMMISNSKLF